MQHFCGSSEPRAVPDSEACIYLSLKGLSISLLHFLNYKFLIFFLFSVQRTFYISLQDAPTNKIFINNLKPLHFYLYVLNLKIIVNHDFKVISTII